MVNSEASGNQRAVANGEHCSPCHPGARAMPARLRISSARVLERPLVSSLQTRCDLCVNDPSKQKWRPEMGSLRVVRRLPLTETKLVPA